MPTHTTNLFLPEELEDVGKASELAEGELTALQAVADWIKSRARPSPWRSAFVSPSWITR